MAIPWVNGGSEKRWHFLESKTMDFSIGLPLCHQVVQLMDTGTDTRDAQTGRDLVSQQRETSLQATYM